MHKIPHEPTHNLNDEIASALEKCANNLSITELSRRTGVRIELLRRFINRQAQTIRAETWDKIYPVLRPYLEGPEPVVEPPPRIGPAYRRHQDLVAMVSNQKVLLDEFAILGDAERKRFAEELAAAGAVGEPTNFVSLTREENRVMGLFLSLPPEKQEEAVLKLSEVAVAVLRRRRAEMF